MDNSLFCFGVLICNFFSLTSSQSLLNLTTDEYALIALKNSIIPNPNNTILLENWSTHNPICGWIGVSCGAKHGRVTALNLTGLGLRGTLPPHLGNLTFLRSLDIRSNNFTAALPSELSKLRRLQYINVGSNNFTGEIPSWLVALSQLRRLYLHNNRFSGGIPSSLFNVSSRLEVLNLDNNQLINGSIPDAIFNISSLIYLNLGRNRLSGKIPNSMCSNTPKLGIFMVGGNELYGEIPRNIGKCRELEVLELQANYFNGNIPTEIGSLSMLQYLLLWQNEFEGSIPEQVGNLTSLIWLNLQSNNVTGSLPKQVGNLTSLTFLSLSSNKLTGELPDVLSDLASVRRLVLTNNSFSGAIPRGIFNISTLLILDLSYNEFSGTLPSNIGLTLLNLEELALQDNSFSGPIPTSINNASQLQYLNLQSNSFSASIPSFAGLTLLTRILLAENNLSGAKSPNQELEFFSSLTNSHNLRLIHVSFNPLNGVLPTSIGNLSQFLELFSSTSAGIRGVIPSEIGNLSGLINLNLYNNQLSGSIPSTIGNLKNLGRLVLAGNKLEGSIPMNLCRMSSLSELHFVSNEVEGPIPECFGEIQSLRVIDFSSNKLNSTIPSNFWNLTNLIFLNLSSNYLSGQISSQIQKLEVINKMDFSSNLFSGDIPNSIDSCQSLEYLSLSNNKLGGSIPQSLGKIRGLMMVDLSNNSLSGMIPESLQDLRFLEYLNVSYNRLEGEIPNGGAFANITAESFVHNSALCGAARFEVPPCAEVDGSKSVSRLMKYILPPLISMMVLVTLIVFIIRRQKHIKAAIPDDDRIGIAWRVTSYIELLQGTDSFSETNLLGRGRFGSVFKGTFSEGLNFAVKVFNLEVEGSNKSFETESRILSTIRHRNLVRIIGCCTNMEFKALILEFMPNGSLERWLYSDNYLIDILRLLDISIDVALALEYLHHGNTFPVVHCDVKPSNVLLDEDMTARVADFGIAKLFEEGEAMIQTKTIATIGYAAPEYGSEGKVSTSADVYSFGIMLLEMFTRKKPTDDMFNGEMSLKEWVSQALQANAVDQVLASALPLEKDGHFVASVFELAMKCLANSPDERINMIEAATILKKIKEKVVAGVTTRRQQHAITIT